MAVQEQPQQEVEVQAEAAPEAVVEQPTPSRYEQIAAGIGELTEEERRQLFLDHPALKPLWESERDRFFESRRQEALRLQKVADDARGRAERRRWLLEGDPDEVKERLYEDERRAVSEEEVYAKAQAEARTAAAQQIRGYFADLPEQDKVELARLSGEVVAGRMTEERLWADAMNRRDRVTRGRWEAERKTHEDEAARLQAVEREASAVETPKPRPDLGGSRGGGPTWTTQREVEAAFLRGEATAADVRTARTNLPY